jgi:hypothetical protein
MMLMQPNQPLPQQQPNYGQQPVQAQVPLAQQPYLPPKIPKQGHGGLVFGIIMTVAFVSALGFGLWAFSGMQENKTNLDAKIEKASDAAVKEAEDAKEAEFAEREKDPNRGYTGPSTYGSLTFAYPKTWSMYFEESESGGTILDLYAHPFAVRGLGSENSFAFRTQILASDFDKEAEKYQKQAEKGTVAVTAFKLELVPTVLGIRVTGEVAKDKQGIAVLVPLRDKTIKIWTESNDFASDFDKVIQSTTFIP